MSHDDMDLDLDIEIDIEIEESPEENPSIICCRVLSALMNADDNFCEREQLFLHNTMNQLELSPEERALAIVPLPIGETEEMLQHLEPSVRKALLDALFQVALVDGQLEASEMNYIHRLRELMGFDE